MLLFFSVLRWNTKGERLEGKGRNESPVDSEKQLFFRYFGYEF
jgi:hypothetical protein